ncbi:succinylglutamate desuccinylase [Labilibacter sediminis]|nr:succinylglutamate desuccinylase [Labilibacter sediminis]
MKLLFTLSGIQISVARYFLQIVCIFCLVHSTLIAQNNTLFTIGSIEVKNGEKVSDSLIVEKGIDEGTFIPITIINGANSGPVLTLFAGIHGTEYVPIITLQQVLNEIDPDEISGTLILVHVANIPSFSTRNAYKSQIDNKNLNRAFPGKKDGTISERIAYTLTNVIIKKSDYFIDLHGGEFNEALINFIYFYYRHPSRELNQKTSMLAHAMGNHYLIPVNYNHVPDSFDNYWSELVAIKNNIPAISVECGDRGMIDVEEIEFTKRGIINVMRTIGMMEGEVFRTEYPLYLFDEKELNSSYNGIFFPLVEEGQYIVKETLIGYTTDYWGNVIEEFRSPSSGIVTVIIKVPAINIGESVCHVHKVKDTFED